MLIAQVLSASTGGIGRHVASLLPRLLERGHQIQVFCPDLTAQAQGFAEVPGVGAAVEVLPLSRLPRARSADVVHAHGYKAGALAAAATLAGPPLVVTWHNAILGGGRSAALGRLLQRGVARAADLT
ncbi:MAG: glycosyltransferase, partial [Propionibacteriaceae bacterium]